MSKQQFQIGQRVHVKKNLPSTMSHFTKDVDAIIVASYAQLYGGRGRERNEYSLLLIPKKGKPYTSSWYDAENLDLVNADPSEGYKLVAKYGHR